MAGNTFDPWEAANRCTGGAAPGALALRTHVLDRFPAARSGGIYNCRPVRGTNTFSHHAEGRGIDIMCDLRTGQAIVKLLGPNGAALGIDELIHNRRIYSAKSPGGRAFNGPSHTDHVHIGLTREGARTLTSARINQILEDSTPWPLSGLYAFGDRPNTRGPWRLRLVDRGPNVRKINQLLLGSDSSIYTANTAREVRKWQASKRIPTTGRVGKREWARLGL